MVEISLVESSAAAGGGGYPSAPGAQQPVAVPPPVEWFYMDLNNEQQGPTDDAGLRTLYQIGEIHDFTYVWNEGLPAWAAVKEVMGAGFAEASVSCAQNHGQHTAFC